MTLEMPSDVAAEAAVIGSLILDPEQLTIVDLQATDFYREAHRTIYRVMQALTLRGDPVDLVTIMGELTRTNELEDVGGFAFLAGVADMPGTAMFAVTYARTVKAYAVRRGIIDAARHAMQDALDGADEPDVILENVEARFLALTSGRTVERVERINVPLLEVFHDLSKPTPLVPNVTWGLPDVDRVTNGLQGGELTIIAARPSMGKTSLALQVAAFNTHRARRVLMFSLEMSNRQLAARLLASNARVDLQRIRTRNLSDRDYVRLADSMGVLSEYPLWLDDDGALSLSELRRRARVIHSRQHLDLIVVDYLQLLTDGARAGQNRVSEMTSISRGLKQLARELDVPIIALSQLSRDVEKRPDKHPVLSDLRDSGSIEQDADVVVFIYRGEYYDKRDADLRGAAEIIIAKQRSGPLAHIPVSWLESATRFDSLTNAYSDADISADMIARDS